MLIVGDRVRTRTFRMSRARRAAVPQSAGRPVLSCVAHNLDAGVRRRSAVARHCGRTSPRCRRRREDRPLRGPIVGQIPASACICPPSPMALVQLRRRVCRRQAQRARPSFRARRRMRRIIYGTGSSARGFNAIQCIEISNNGKSARRNVQGWREGGCLRRSGGRSSRRRALRHARDRRSRCAAHAPGGPHVLRRRKRHLADRCRAGRIPYADRTARG